MCVITVFAAPVETQSKINEVMVYSNGAMTMSLPAQIGGASSTVTETIIA